MTTIELSLAASAAAAVLLVAGGIVIGYVLCHARLQREGGGKTAGELREELERYRERVASHFERSAVLFHQLTVRHRELYEHLAESAESLGATGDRERLRFDELLRLALEPPRAGDRPAEERRFAEATFSIASNEPETAAAAPEPDPTPATGAERDPGTRPRPDH